MSQSPAPAKPSASVVVARDGNDGLEILLLRRNEKIVFHGGAWVFPGGRVDDADIVGDDQDELTIARVAAAREAHEETGLELTTASMLPFAHWTTPVELPKRFSTWFFVALLREQVRVQIDGSEIVDYRWMTPDAALAAHTAGDISLPGPTFVTLLGFSVHRDTDAMARALDNAEVEHFVPRLVSLDDGRCALYAEDAGYDSLDIAAPGARHRLVMRGTHWDYQREF